MDRYAIVFSVNKLSFSNDPKEVKKNSLCFPDVLRKVVSEAFLGKPYPIDEKILSYYNIDVKNKDGFILLEKSVDKGSESDVYIDRIFIKIPWQHINYLNVEMVIKHSPDFDRLAMFDFINDISENEDCFNRFVKDKSYKLNKNPLKHYGFAEKKLLETLKNNENLQLRYFNQNEIYMNNNESLNFCYSDDVGLLIYIYENENAFVYENEDIKIDKLIFTKRIKNNANELKTKKFKVSFASVDRKIEGIQNNIKVRYNQKSNGDPIINCENYKIFINDFYGEIIFHFKENEFSPIIEGCVFNEEFDSYGIGEINKKEDSVEGRVIISSKYSEEMNLFLMNIIRNYKIKKKEVVAFLGELPKDITEDELLNLLEINFINNLESKEQLFHKMKKRMSSIKISGI